VAASVPRIDVEHAGFDVVGPPHVDAAAYLPLFVAETQEHLQSLNLAVVRIEERPDDRETLDEIFRAAHSMKGMSATMGFSAKGLVRERTPEQESERQDPSADGARERAGGRPWSCRCA
jgi:hypothetical protein